MYPPAIPRLFIPETADVRAQVLATSEAEAIAAVQAELDALAGRREARAAAADRGWTPSWRCKACHKYVSPGHPCTSCGSREQSNDEGKRTSYETSHQRFLNSPLAHTRRRLRR